MKRFRTVLLFALCLCLLTTAIGCRDEQIASAPNGSDSSGETGWKPKGSADLIVPSSAGGGHDVAARALAQQIESITGVKMNVINNATGNGVVGRTEIATGVNDGSLIGQVDQTALTDSLTVDGCAYNRDSFRWVGIMNKESPHFSVSATGPFADMNFDEIIAYAKAHPGEVSIAHSGTWHTYEFARYLVEQHAGVKFNVVKIKGGNNCILAMLGGDVDITINYPNELLGQAEAGALKVVAQCGEERNNYFPDTPTLKEMGLDIILSGLKAWVLPKDVSDAVYEGWCSIFRRTMEDEKTREIFDSVGVTYALLQGEEMESFLDEVYETQLEVYNSDEYKASLGN